MTAPDWKTVRDGMIQHLRSQLSESMPQELVTLMAKFEVKLRGFESEADFNDFNKLAEKTLQEVSAQFEIPIRLEMLKRLTA